MEEASVFGRVMAKVSAALMTSEQIEHVYALVSGNSVSHLHMHLVARYINTPKKYWGPMAVYDWVDAPRGDENEVIEFCQRIKVYLESY